MNQELSELPESLLNREVQTICKRYRIDPDTVRELLETNFAKNPDLVRKIIDQHPEADVTRMSAYKLVVKETKKQIYYHLRQYKRDREVQNRALAQLATLVAEEAPQAKIKAVIHELLLTHVSTQERVPYYDAFYHRLFELIEPPRTILDLGCGLHPLSYPFYEAELRPKVYYALDRAEDAIAVVSTFAPAVHSTHLKAVCQDLATVAWTDYAESAFSTFDFAFLLKLIPVIHRLQPEAVEKLANTPARQILITASTEALTRRENIRRREDRILQSFIAMTRRPVLADFEIGTEFGYLLGSR